MRRRIKPIDTLPKELARSAPRQVTLTASGIGIAIAIAGLVAGAIVAPVLISQRMARDTEPVGETEALIRDVRRRDERFAVSFTYVVEGSEYGGTTRVRRRDRGKFVPGAAMPAQYVLSRPGDSWLKGYGRRPTPFWLIGAVPGLLLLCSVPIVIVVRRQAALLREGRSAVARVTKTEKRNTGEGTSWRVEYEWRLINGAVRSGRHDSGKNPPPVGALIPIVYDRDNPKRHRPYPMSLVKVAR